MRAHVFAIPAFAVLTAFSLVACGGASSHLQSTSSDGSAIPENPSGIDPNSAAVSNPNGNPVLDFNVITIADANSTITRAVGQQIVVQLSEAQDGGYMWSVGPTNLGIPDRQSQSTAPGGNPPTLGAPDLVTFTWETRGVAVGTYPLIFTEAQASDPDTATSFSVTIVISP